MAEENKSSQAKREEEILTFWKEGDIFKKSLEKEAPNGEFVFYEGPPTANGKPGIHHLESRAFKDAIPRYKTMQGYTVRRKAGWDTHGLPVELEVEKQLGLKSKKEVEEYGVAPFNKKCKESVWKYLDDWNKFTERIGFWVDQKDPYVTYDPRFMESLWSVIAHVHGRDLLYKDYKVLPWCPRCGTALSSHELAQGYKDVKDLSVTAEFVVEEGSHESLNSGVRTALLAWTTTPWTLPGNVALAVGPDLDYVVLEKEDEGGSGRVRFVVAKDLLDIVFKDSTYDVVVELKGADLVGTKYQPLYPYMGSVLEGEEKEKLDEKAYRVYPADFVTTEDGTGIVHTAVMYGQDDFVLGTEIGLPKYHLVNLDGTFSDSADFLSGRFVRDEDVAVDIIKDLAHRDILFSKEKYEHSYPHCWRCKTPVIYYARDSWYIRMSELRDELVKENDEINWVPSHIKEGRFGEWLREIKDWAISRERYWGTPLPIWVSEDGEEMLVIDSVETLKKHIPSSGNQYLLMRHGQSQSNADGRISSVVSNDDGLTEQGRKETMEAAASLKDERIDLIYTSPFKRTMETTEIVAKELGLSEDAIIVDERIGEIKAGKYEGKTWDDYYEHFGSLAEAYRGELEDGENFLETKRRVGEFLFSIDKEHAGKKILIVSHGGVMRGLLGSALGLTSNQMVALQEVGEHSFANAQIERMEFSAIPHDDDYVLDLHRPYIDEVNVLSEKGTPLKRVPEVMDVWFDSGAMPFAQDHYPFENKERIDSVGYPADFISEAIDQTRGWFYTLHAVGVLMGRGKAYRNVICLGHILDAEGKKMSKSVGNVVNPWDMIEKYGVDALRFWMYSVNQPGDSKNFDERTVDEIVKKVFNLLSNSAVFFEMQESTQAHTNSGHILDRWIISRLNALIGEATSELEAFNLLTPSRAIREFIGDLSQWYIRRSRARFKAGDQNALATLRYVLLNLSKVMAPMTPFVAEDVYQKTKSEEDPESVHLCQWPEPAPVDQAVLDDMKSAREAVSLLLERRASSKLKIRQPLAKAVITSKLDDEYLKIVAEEVNVHEVVVNTDTSEVSLDTELTDELKLEGALRELVRHVQSMRKQAGLTQGDQISLELSDTPYMQQLLGSHKEELMEQVRATSVVTIADLDGSSVEAHGEVLVARIA